MTVSLGRGRRDGGRNISVELGTSELRRLHINKKCVSQICLSIYGPVECVTESSCFFVFFFLFYFFLSLPKKNNLLRLGFPQELIHIRTASTSTPKTSGASHAWNPPLNVTVRCHKLEEICHEAYFPTAPTPPLKPPLFSSVMRKRCDHRLSNHRIRKLFWWMRGKSERGTRQTAALRV